MYRNVPSFTGSQSFSRAPCETTPSCWKQLFKMVSTTPSNPVFPERVRPHTSGHVAGPGQSWLLGQDRWQHQRCVSSAKVPQWPWDPQPHCHSLQEPEVPPLQHLGSTSQTHPGTEAALWWPTSTKAPTDGGAEWYQQFNFPWKTMCQGLSSHTSCQHCHSQRLLFASLLPLPFTCRETFGCFS